ncbi:hypothetical protein EVAR_59902_1 [Eumeta japonica]|uniref:Uncharacterized protein n=1 Tax=Eumeta variegata TaxID=151549 RepID=A0A4C2ACV4_EUMVA|nr:hypothetical protein EVAR_59902_1 [Eumeta japonica]
MRLRPRQQDAAKFPRTRDMFLRERGTSVKLVSRSEAALPEILDDARKRKILALQSERCNKIARLRGSERYTPPVQRDLIIDLDGYADINNLHIFHQTFPTWPTHKLAKQN